MPGRLEPHYEARRRRFQVTGSARFDGEPIPYYYRLTVDFDLRH